MIGLTIWTLISLVVQSVEQVAPTWDSSPFMKTGLFTMSDNTQLGAGTTFLDVPYGPTFVNPYPTFVNPYVILALNQLRIVSNNQNFGFKCSISGLPMNSQFTARLQIFGDTKVFTIRIRFLAYEHNELGNIITTNYVDKSNAALTVINSNTVPAQPRTYTQLVTYYNSAQYPIANQVICAAYTTGFTGTSNDNYQVNVSCMPFSDTQFQLTIQVSSQTIITAITIYAYVSDKTELEEASQHFVDYQITRASLGVQYIPFTPPHGTFENGLLVGLRSFSIRNSQQFNYAISGTSFTTQAAQYYVDSSNFQVRIRICQTPSTYYNKVDGLCYNPCPAQTYKVQAYTVCQPCHYTCATCTDATSCGTCKINRTKTPLNLCPCSDYYYQFNQVCVACHYSCQTCSNAQNFDCITCEATKSRTKDPATGRCDCDPGYSDIGVALCSPFCGDGILQTDECDDGNNVNGDGCNSQCKIQTNFTCSGSPSQCFYNAKLQLNIQKIQKEQFTNTARFYVKMTPYIDMLAKLAGTDSLSTNLTFVSITVHSEPPYLVYTGVYANNIQGQSAQIFLKPAASGPFSQLPSVNATFMASSTNSLPLLHYQETTYSMALSMQVACSILSYIMIASSVFFSFGAWKLIGTQTYFIMQFMFMSIVIIPNFTPILSALGTANTVMGYNGILGQNQTQYSSWPTIYQMGYSVPYHFNVNVMLATQGFALIMYIIYKIVERVNLKRIIEGKLSISDNFCGKIIRVFRFEFFVYWTFINANQFIFATALQVQSTLNTFYWALAVPCLLSLLIAVITVILSPKAMASYRIKPFHDDYGGQTFLLQIIGLIILDLSLVIGVLVASYLFYISFAVPLFLIIFAIARRPFKSFIDLGRFIANYCFLAVSLALVALLLNLSSQDTLYLPIGILVCIILTFILNLVICIILMVLNFIDKDKESKTQSHQEQLRQMRRLMKYQETANIKQNTERKPLMLLGRSQTQRKYQNISNHQTLKFV